MWIKLPSYKLIKPHSIHIRRPQMDGTGLWRIYASTPDDYVTVYEAETEAQVTSMFKSICKSIADGDTIF